MTSFTECTGTSFTLPPERSEGGSKSALSEEGKDGLGNERYWGATGTIRAGEKSPWPSYVENSRSRDRRGMCGSSVIANKELRGWKNTVVDRGTVRDKRQRL
jgi:hypothetical protein